MNQEIPILDSGLQAYPDRFRYGPWLALGNSGGFSGSRIWKAVMPDGQVFGLKRWPTSMSLERLAWIHRHMHLLQGIAPKLQKTMEGSTFVLHQEHLWEISTWLPGSADFQNDPKEYRLQQIMYTLAKVHQIWQQGSYRIGPAPAIQRRLQALADWRQLQQSGWRPNQHDPRIPQEIHVLVPIMQTVIEADWEQTERLLYFWSQPKLVLQPCFCDIWHDHVLFVGDQLSGIVDYGGMKIDHISVDLARLLGSLFPNDPERFRQGLHLYQQQHPLNADERELIHILHSTGQRIGLTNWLRWIYHENRTFQNWSQVQARIQTLLGNS